MSRSTGPDAPAPVASSSSWGWPGRDRAARRALDRHLPGRLRRPAASPGGRAPASMSAGSSWPWPSGSRSSSRGCLNRRTSALYVGTIITGAVAARLPDRPGGLIDGGRAGGRSSSASPSWPSPSSAAPGAAAGAGRRSSAGCSCSPAARRGSATSPASRTIGRYAWPDRAGRAGDHPRRAGVVPLPLVLSVGRNRPPEISPAFRTRPAAPPPPRRSPRRPRRPSRTSSSSVTTKGGPSRMRSPSTPSALPVPE